MLQQSLAIAPSITYCNTHIFCRALNKPCAGHGGSRLPSRGLVRLSLCQRHHSFYTLSLAPVLGMPQLLALTVGGFLTR